MSLLWGRAGFSGSGRETVVLPQLQLVEKIVAFPEVVQVSFLHFVDKVVDVPVVVQRQVPWPRQCKTPSGSAAVAVYWTSCRLPCCGAEARDARHHGWYGPEGRLRGEIHVDKAVDVAVVGSCRFLRLRS